MKLKEMILHYRDTGQRVDEVLYQEVMQQIARVQELEEIFSVPKLNLWARVQNERLRANRLQKHRGQCREVLGYVAELDCIDWNKEELAKMARKTLEETK